MKPAASNGDGTDASGEGRCPYIGLASRDGLLEPMLLWDATMAKAIAEMLDQQPGSLVVHVCGSFHCERRLGIAERLDALRPASPAKQCVRGASGRMHVTTSPLDVS